LPAGLTVQDAQGELLLVNDAAASQLGMDGSRPSPDLAPRREACQQALMSGQPVISEEALHDGAARQVLLTTHRPVRLAGRELLIEQSKRLGRYLRYSDMLSRISGDEFLLLLSPIQSQEEVAEFIQSTLELLTAPFFIDNSELFASTSVGISLYPDHGRSFEMLRQNADIAMYRVKNDGKGMAAFFDASMEREALARTRIEQSLRMAILEKR